MGNTKQVQSFTKWTKKERLLVIEQLQKQLEHKSSQGQTMSATDALEYFDLQTVLWGGSLSVLERNRNRILRLANLTLAPSR